MKHINYLKNLYRYNFYNLDGGDYNYESISISKGTCKSIRHSLESEVVIHVGLPFEAICLFCQEGHKYIITGNQPNLISSIFREGSSLHEKSIRETAKVVSQPKNFKFSIECDRLRRETILVIPLLM